MTKERKQKEKMYDNVDELFSVFEASITSEKAIKWSGDNGRAEKELVAMKPILQQLRGLRTNLSFHKGSVVKALRKLALAKEEEWALGDDAESWSEMTASKLIKACQ